MCGPSFSIASVPQRILVYGVTGSGKTTFAARLAEKTGLPWHSVDDLTWEPGWVEVPPDEQRRRIGAICSGQQWILDTAYSKWLDVALCRVQSSSSLWTTRDGYRSAGSCAAAFCVPLTIAPSATATQSRSASCYPVTRSSYGTSAPLHANDSASRSGPQTGRARQSCASTRSLPPGSA